MPSVYYLASLYPLEVSNNFVLKIVFFKFPNYILIKGDSFLFLFIIVIHYKSMKYDFICVIVCVTVLTFAFNVSTIHLFVPEFLSLNI